jgi:hypothetical protein
MTAREMSIAVLLAMTAFVIILGGILISLVTGYYQTLFDGLNWFLDWKHAGTATMAVALAALIAGARLWRWLGSR